MKCVIFETVDGSALVGRICDQAGEVISPDINKHLDEVVALDPNLVSWRITDHLNLPGGSGEDRFDNTFKGAFTDKLAGEQVDVDMPRARVIHKGRIREERDKKLSKLDIEQMKGNDVAAEKQALRDLPATFDLEVATTPEELKVLWPAELR